MSIFFEKILKIFSGIRTWNRQNQLFAYEANVFGAFCLQKRTRFPRFGLFCKGLTSQNAVLTLRIWAKVRDPGKVLRVPGGAKNLHVAPHPREANARLLATAWWLLASRFAGVSTTPVSILTLIIFCNNILVFANLPIKIGLFCPEIWLSSKTLLITVKIAL